MNLKRWGEDKLKKWVKPGRVVVVYGPRRVGKTTLVKKFKDQYKGKVWYATGDDRDLRMVLESQSLERLRRFFSGYELVIIDEAQRIKEVGLSLKLLVDNLDVAVIATGSASFELTDKLGEPLTGRKRVVQLWPLAMEELKLSFGGMVETRLKEFLIYGTYPEVVLAESNEEKWEILKEIRDSYLLKDVLQLAEVRHEGVLMKLLQLLAWQVGSEVSLGELANRLEVSKQVIKRYLYLLEKSFVIVGLGGFSRNLRREVTKMKKYYFVDLGVRNVVIGDFKEVEMRNDVGQLWENWMVIEMMRKYAYEGRRANFYFWRTYDGQEIDLVVEEEGKLKGYEFKWGKKKVKEPVAWRKAYPEAEWEVVNGL